MSSNYLPKSTSLTPPNTFVPIYIYIYPSLKNHHNRTPYCQQPLMEKLKSLIPEDLRGKISDSTVDDLPHTCSSLLHFLNPLPQFQRVLGELADVEKGLCRKSVDTALDFKKKGNDCFSAGDYSKALSFYSQALRFAPTSSDGNAKNMVATLFVNRASSLHKLELYEECLRDCDRAIVVSPLYAKAWYRRGKAKTSLKHYEDAIQDFEAALNLKDSISEKRHIKEELEMVSSMCKRTIGTNKFGADDKNKIPGSLGHTDVETCQIELQCVSTEVKGRGMTSSTDILPGSMVHSEEPLAAVIVKSCRETHCHFCLTVLQADAVFCLSCATPSYCSENCRDKADLGHRHECGGVNWPAILPSDVVLAARIMAIFLGKRSSSEISKLETSEFTHHYIHATPDRKLGMQIYSIVLSHCLNYYFGSKFSFTGSSASQLVVLLSQIEVNSMAVISIKSFGYGAVKHARDNIEDGYTCNIEQVRVGQAVYLIGRLFNHSCQPNINAYFLSRKLFLRSTEFVPAGYPLELSYGPQVGQLDYWERQRLLKDQYYFECQCTNCSEINLTDIVIHAFHCMKPNCSGAVLETGKPFHQMMNESCMQVPFAACNLELPLPVSKQKRDAINEVAHILLQRPGALRQIGTYCCLSCGVSHDLLRLSHQAENALIGIKRLQHAIISRDVNKAVLSDALRSLGHLRLVRHAYCKDIAEAEDIVAEAFCLIGKSAHALQHCKASIEVLKQLYHTNHIVIGNELVKLASIQLSLDDRESVMNSVEQLEAIFSLYYGSHADEIFPYLEGLRRQQCG